jgi:capping protein (actin filament) muscle Z-line, alpha
MSSKEACRSQPMTNQTRAEVAPKKEVPSCNHIRVMEPEERVQAACSFILQSPPGEINDVLNGTLDPTAARLSTVLTVVAGDSADVRNIISDDDSLHNGIQPALKQYNMEQFITVDVPGTSHQVRVTFS